jgi:hypothetical protein
MTTVIMAARDASCRAAVAAAWAAMALKTASWRASAAASIASIE